ncbi:MAG: DegT/DnrJ/EryC1/StrS family aminotransferase [Verrucomicrobiae bacterium]|nr:DegT/DnrJ/EryC1/StrS family aminotransferase [Verrucomicrobiae bacterium]
MRKIPLSKVFLTEEMKQAAIRALESGRYILAEECQAFEKELAAHTGTKEAVLTSSWTSGVFMLFQALGLKEGDEVLVPSHTAFPSIEPIIHWEAKPIFVDVDETYCLAIEELEKKRSDRTVGILPVHLYGHPADLDAVFAFAKKHKLWVVEDCAQAQGARYRGNRVGSMGIAGAFSFFPSKNLTVMGDGGCICTNDPALAEKVRMLRNHGRKEKYSHEFVGYNQRFNEIQAALGRIGLRELDTLNAHRRAIASRYREKLPSSVQCPPEREWAEPVYHMFVIRAPRRDELAKFLRERGVETGMHYPIANHQQPAITSLYANLPALPRTEKLVGEILSLPIHGQLPLEDADHVCELIGEFYGS